MVKNPSFLATLVAAARAVIPSLFGLAVVFGGCWAASEITRARRRRNHPTERLRVYGQVGSGVVSPGPRLETRHRATQARHRRRLTNADYTEALRLLHDHRLGQHDDREGAFDPVLGCEFPGCSAAYWLVQTLEDDR